ncbi:MAG TPA: hypothetical protein VMM36_11505 [Opitutaceae bacterium]|nr:hypothetical protein [Opitutaceae bacterium]
MNSPARVVLIAFAAITFAHGASAQVVDTASAWDGSSFIAPFGQGIEDDGGDTPTYGQTFVAPGTMLDLTSFTFWVDSVGGSGPSRFTGFVMEFDGSGVTGPVLFEGAEVSLAISESTFPYVPSFTPVTFDMPSLALDPAKTYVAFISAIPFFDGQDDTANVGYLFADTYADGGFWFSPARTWEDLVGEEWENFIGGGTRDLAFHATFSTVPEPAATTLVGAIALTALVFLRRRARHAP